MTNPKKIQTGIPFPEIAQKVQTVRPVSTRQVRRYIEKAGIRPIGIRQSPQRYPMDTVDRVLASLGLASSTSRGRIITAPEAIRRGKAGVR